MLSSLQYFGAELLESPLPSSGCCKLLAQPGSALYRSSRGAISGTTVELFPVHARLVLAGNKMTVQEFGGFR